MKKMKSIIMRLKNFLSDKSIKTQESRPEDSLEAKRITKYILKHFGRAITRLSDR